MGETLEKCNPYDRGPYHWFLPYFYARRHERPLDWIRGRLGPDDLILDLGCGDGRHSALLAPRTKAVIGLDHQQLPLQYARLLLGSSRVALSRGDGIKLPLRSRCFAGVVCLDVIEHLPQSRVRLLLGEIKRVLKAGGWALISTPNRKSLYNRIWGHKLSQKHYFEYSLSELCSAVAYAGLRVEVRSGIYLPPLILRPYLEHYASVFPVKHVFRWLIHAGAALPGWSETILVLASTPTETANLQQPTSPTARAGDKI